MGMRTRWVAAVRHPATMGRAFMSFSFTFLPQGSRCGGYGKTMKVLGVVVGYMRAVGASLCG
ncbi:hypothetical protein, partial [Dermatophilus congolensis]|uniref:hypothetical protein n=1 Tax=Dermatophilus congolensis TaxID=1863 RepID=UPI001AB0551F